MPLPLPPRFLREAEKEKNSPFMLLAIDSRGQSDEATTEEHWSASSSASASKLISATNVDSDSSTPPPDSGDVILAAAATSQATTVANGYPTSNILNQWDSGDYTSVNNASDASYLQEGFASPGVNDDIFRGAIPGTTIRAELPVPTNIVNVKVTARCKTEADAHLIRLAFSDGTLRWSASIALSSGAVWANYSNTWTINPATGVAWQPADIDDLVEVGISAYEYVDTGGTIDCSSLYLQVTYADFETSGSIVVQLDLGASANTSNDAIISIDDLVPTGAGLTYTLEGSDTGAFSGEETDLGAVEDGSRVQGFRYYQPTANLAGTATVTPTLKSIKIEIPDNVYRFTTLPGNALTALSTLDALPLVTTLPGRTIEIDLKSFITKTSNMTVNLSRTDFVDEMVRGNYFRGLAVDIKLGMLFDGVAEDDMIPYYQGRITDYQLTPRELRIEVQDASKDLSAKWPIGTAPASPPIQAYSSPTHMVDVINEIIDDIGIKTRYVDRGSLDSVKANVGTAVAASNYVVFRGVDGATDTTIKDSEPAKDYITELLQLLGTYLVIPENGKLTVVLYDASTTSQETWDEDVYDKDANFRAGLKGLKNVTDLFYDGTGDGEALKNFGSIYITADSTSMADWDITAIKKIVSLWLAGDSTTGYYGTELATEITDRETTRLKDGLGLFSCKTSLVKAGFQVGEFIDIDSDTVIKPDIGVGDTQKFMIIKKTWEAASNYVSWILMEAR